MLARSTGALVCALLVLGFEAGAGAQYPGAPQYPTPSIQKVSDTSYRIGPLTVDTERREVTAPAHLNDIMTAEFVANATPGAKAYESVLSVEADPIMFNTALLLIGLDPAHGHAPKFQFDQTAATGDPVELFVTWGQHRARVEELLFDRRTNTTLPEGKWVYTGSTFIDTGDGHKRYMAELDGVLIGLMHGPSAIIERVDAATGFGAVVRNTMIDLQPGTPVTLTVHAVSRTAERTH